jgi:2-oxoglutarate dehydrogenase E2 component (dihydrolipoamide succinyltransferase)
MAYEVQIPAMGESVSEVILIEWLKADGDYVERDEPICVLETDKANVDLPAPNEGILRHKEVVDATLGIGSTIAEIEDGERPEVDEPKAEIPQKEISDEPMSNQLAEKILSPAAQRLVEENNLDVEKLKGTGKDGRITKEDVTKYLSESASKATPSRSDSGTKNQSDNQGTRREPMSRLRQRVAEHLVNAQNSAAMLTTFNEVDMHAVMSLRKQYKERFAEVHGVSLGLMSFFSRAVVLALKEFPVINAQIDGSDIVYNDQINLGIAVSTERGLVVPVLQRAESLSMADIEGEIKRLAFAARDNKLAMDELSGGTFTVTNGGVFGSLLSTPILNAPQSGILGMHTIQQRPVVIDTEIVVRPMMYVALSYDHRIIDGQQSVSFLVRVKELIEDPARLMLEI